MFFAVMLPVVLPCVILSCLISSLVWFSFCFTILFLSCFRCALSHTWYVGISNSQPCPFVKHVINPPPTNVSFVLFFLPQQPRMMEPTRLPPETLPGTSSYARHLRRELSGNTRRILPPDRSQSTIRACRLLKPSLIFLATEKGFLQIQRHSSNLAGVRKVASPNTCLLYTSPSPRD